MAEVGAEAPTSHQAGVGATSPPVNDIPPGQTVCHLPHIPVGGRLSLFHLAWKNFPTDQWVLRILKEGYRITFLHGPPRFNGVRSTPLVGRYTEVLLQEVQSLLDKRAVELVPEGCVHQGYYSTYFLVPKKTGDLRPILNLKAFNKKTLIPSFKMESLNNIIQSINLGDWLASVDLKDAYLHVPIHPDHRKFLRFSIDGVKFQWKVLPFGISTAPRVFTKVLSPVIAALRLRGVHIHPYLDDLLIRAGSFHQLQEAVHTTLELLQTAGFVVNLKKSDLTPCQDLVFIGGRFRTDSGMVFLPEDRITALVKLVSLFKVGKYFTLRLWLRLLGVMAAAIQVVKLARLYMRPFQFHIIPHWTQPPPLDKKVIVPFHLQEFLSWWSNPDNLRSGIPLSPPDFVHVITTDASGDGWGGVLDGVHTVSGCWKPHQKVWHINRLEMLAVFLTLKHFCHTLTNKVVLVRTDNSTTCHYINKLGGTKSKELCYQLWELVHWCLDKHIQLRAVHVPGLLNQMADALSRNQEVSISEVQLDQREWSLNSQVVEQLFQRLGTPSLDLFASRTNYKLPLWYSWAKEPAALAWNAFSQKWDSFAYAFPPHSILRRVIHKIKQDKALVILIAPFWPHSPWISDLLEMLVDLPIRLPVRQDLLLQEGTYHDNPQFWKLTAWKVSGNPTLPRDFRKKLSVPSRQPEDLARWEPTGGSGLCLHVGVGAGMLIPFDQM